MPLGIDIGGTFTDFVLIQDGRLTVHKLPSTPHDHAGAFLEGVSGLGEAALRTPIVHGTTVATNTLLERKGARTALITTKGFRDILEIGRQTRPYLYALEPRRPAPLVPRELRFEVDERVDYQGNVLRALDESALDGIIDELRRQGVESVAVSLLFSFLRDGHERIIARRLQDAGFFVSASSSVLPEFREYERTSTTVVNAYVSPVLERYLTRLEEQLPAAAGPLRIMQSNGGLISTQTAKAAAARTVLSGPAAGVVGAAYMAGISGYVDAISFDMGGTSTDVSLVAGRMRETTETVIAGAPIRLPMLDIHTVGAGGGSIARLDAGGALRVGPESAGADPGPACYGKGDQVTVTDAQLVLGRLDARHFLGGRMVLDEWRARDRLADLARKMGIDPVDAAWGILRVASANMEKAIRVISVERGYDPRRFTLVAFGGAGPLHACDLADALGIPRVLVPRYPGVLSALGMLAADIMKDYSQTVMWKVPAVVEDGFVRQIAMGFRSLAARGWLEIIAEGYGRETAEVLTALDMRYAGQSYELVVPFDAASTSDLTGRFHATHRERFGYSMPGEPIEIVNLRMKMLGRVQRPSFPQEPLGPEDAAGALLEERHVGFPEPLATKVYTRDELRPGNLVHGPALLVQMDATTVIPPGWQGKVDGVRNLVLERKAF